MKVTKGLLRKMIKEEINNNGQLNEIGFLSKMGSAIGLGSVTKSRGIGSQYKKYRRTYAESQVLDGEAGNILALIRRGLKNNVEDDQWDPSKLEELLPKIDKQAKFADEFNAGAAKGNRSDDFDVVSGALAKLANSLVERPKSATSTLSRINDIIEKTASHPRGLAHDAKSEDEIQMEIDGLT